MKDEISVLELIRDWYLTRENPNIQAVIVYILVFICTGIFLGLGAGEPGVVLFSIFALVAVFAPQLWWHRFFKMDKEKKRTSQEVKEEEDFEGFLHLKSLEAWHKQMDQGIDPDEEVQKHYVSILQRHLKVPISGEMDLVTVQACRNCRCEDYCKSTMDFLKNKKWRM